MLLQSSEPKGSEQRNNVSCSTLPAP